MKECNKPCLSRRHFLRDSSTAALGLALGATLAPWARSAGQADLTGLRPRAGAFDLSVARTPCRVDGKQTTGTLINGQLPAPLLRWREGESVVMRVHNQLQVDTSIHWHGILLPFHMDGVPGVSFPGIRPGQTFTYEFPLLQSGTYWYHSHSGLQEQVGHYGPLVVEPAEPDPDAVERDYVIVLSDWTFEDPHRVYAKLKKMSDNYNFQQRTVGEFLRDATRTGWRPTVDDRLMWGAMRMNAADIADVTGSTYTYLINGHGPGDNWTGMFEPGQRIRLRFINASAMSIFNVRIPGLPMTVVHADGLPVQPVETDEFQIGAAETFDVIVSPDDRAYTVMAESNDRSGYARATLTPRLGLEAPVPARRLRPTLTMKDMAMDHGSMGHGSMDHEAADHAAMDHGSMGHGEMDQGSMNHEATDHAAMDHGSMGHGEMNHAGMDHSAMGHAASRRDSMTASRTVQAHHHPTGPGVVGLATNPVNRLGERPLGLEDVEHRVLVYTDLRAREPNPDTREPERELELHLTSNMERYMWSFDGIKFSEVDGPIKLYKNERVRLTLVNDTMMPHPIHLHGMFFELVTGETTHKPRKHTVVVKPGEKMAVDITADAVGDWAFHCHLLYHMHAGMMRVVSVLDEPVPV